MAVLILTALATAQTADYTGVWYLVSIESQGVAINPADMGMEMMLTLNDDGTGTSSSTGEEDTVTTWTLDGDVLTVVADDVPLSFTLSEEGKLTGEFDDTTMTFAREPAGPDFVAAPEVPAEDIAAFNGTWNVTRVNFYGMILPFEALAQSGQFNADDATLEISDGKVAAFDSDEPLQGGIGGGQTHRRLR